MRLNTYQWRESGLETCQLTIDIEKKISNRVPSIIYINNPIADWYYVGIGQKNY